MTSLDHITRRSFLGGCSVALAGAAGIAKAGQTSENDVVRPQARVETAPVPNDGDAADDPAFWLHPTRPEQSLLFGTNKQGGVHVYNLDGTQRQLVGDGCHPNNVDVLYGFRLGDQVVDLILATARAARTRGVKIWRIDPTERSLVDVTDGNVLPVFGGGEPYGCCTYRSARDGRHYFFANNKDGVIEQHRLIATDRRTVGSTRVRTLRVRSQPEGCVADDGLGHLYVGEERAGVWKFSAEPNGDTTGNLIARVGRHGLTADVEGLTIYYATNGRGYLIVSSQGNNTFKVYEREGDNRFVLTIDPRRGEIDDVSDTDGICVLSCPTTRQFPRGVFVVQDGSNAGGNQNFKLYGWEDIAGDRLLIDTRWSPRRG